MLWLYGSGFRNGVTEPPRFEPSAGFAFVSLDEGDDGRYGGRAPSTRVGACVPVSSALAAVAGAQPRVSDETRARARRPLRRRYHRRRLRRRRGLGLDGASLAVAAPTSVSRVAPEAVSAGGGGGGCSRGSPPPPPRRRTWAASSAPSGRRPAVRGGGARHAFVRRARARAQPVRVARSPNFSARGGDRRGLGRRVRVGGRGRFSPATPPAWRTSAATRRTAPLGRRAPSSFPPRWRRTRPRTCASSARARTSCAPPRARARIATTS